MRKLHNCITCGKERLVNTSDLKAGRKHECRSCVSKRIATTHGYKGTRIYRIWSTMKSRCNNPNRKDFYRYGGRGIAICEQWNRFENFLADMGNGYQNNLTIDRIDNDGNYEPLNCRWATYSEQALNRHPKGYYGKS